MLQSWTVLKKSSIFDVWRSLNLLLMSSLVNNFHLVYMQLPSKHLLVLKTSCQNVFSVTILRPSRRLEDVLRRRLEDVLKTSWRRFQGLSKNVLKTSWKTKKCYAEDVLNTSWRHVLKTSWRHVLKTSSRHLEDISWRRLQDVSEANKMFTGDICT